MDRARLAVPAHGARRFGAQGGKRMIAARDPERGHGLGGKSFDGGAARASDERDAPAHAREAQGGDEAGWTAAEN
jgi:hypothetical protein